MELEKELLQATHDQAEKINRLLSELHSVRQEIAEIKNALPVPTVFPAKEVMKRLKIKSYAGINSLLRAGKLRTPDGDMRAKGRSLYITTESINEYEKATHHLHHN
jgi:hypothetical protein